MPINLPDDSGVSEIVLPDGSNASEVIGPDGNTIWTAIPDSDLTQYTLTDPDNVITVVSSDSYEARLANGANEQSRLYENTPLETLRLSFDLTVLDDSSGEGEASHFGWSTNQDTTYSDADNLILVRFGKGSGGSPRKIQLSDGSDNGDTSNGGTDIANYSLNTQYRVEADFDIDAEEVTGRVLEGGSQIGSATIPFDPSRNWDWHYAQMATGADFGNAGTLDFDVENYGFEPL